MLRPILILELDPVDQMGLYLDCTVSPLITEISKSASWEGLEQDLSVQ